MFKSFVSLICSFLLISHSIMASQEFVRNARGQLIIADQGAPLSQNYRQVRSGLVQLGLLLDNSIRSSDGARARELARSIRQNSMRLPSTNSPSAEAMARVDEIRAALSELQGLIPERTRALFAGREEYNPEQLREFDRSALTEESTPSYCENYPLLDRETLYEFYESNGEVSESNCFEVGGHNISLDIDKIGATMLSLEEDAYEQTTRSLTNRLILNSTQSLLGEGLAYSGIYPEVDPQWEGLENCARTQGQQNMGNQELLTLLNEHKGSASQSVQAMNGLFDHEENGRQRAFMAHQIRHALIVSNLFHITKNSMNTAEGSFANVGNEDPTFVPEVYDNCYREMEETHGFSMREGPNGFLQTAARCEQLVSNGEYPNQRSCEDRYAEVVNQPWFWVEQRQCYYRQAGREEDMPFHIQTDQLIPMMSHYVENNPLLFDRSDMGSILPFNEGASYRPSPFVRAVRNLPNASNLSRAVVQLLATNPDDPAAAIDQLLAGPEWNQTLNEMIASGVASEELNNSLKEELGQYHDELEDSATRICTTDGEFLHHFPSLVESALEDEIDGSPEGRAREEALARGQAAHCWMLQESPPEEHGGLPLGVVATGVGAIALGLIPGLGWAGLAALAVGSGVSVEDARRRYNHAQDRLEATEGAFHGGWVDAQELLLTAGATANARNQFYLEAVTFGALDLGLLARRSGEIREGVASAVSGLTRRGPAALSREEVIARVDDMILNSTEEGVHLPLRTNDGEFNLILTQRSRNHYRGGHVLDDSDEELISRIEDAAISAVGRQKEKVFRRLASDGNTNATVNRLASELYQDPNSPYRKGLSQVTFFPPGVRPSEVIADMHINGVRHVGDNALSGTREFRYQDEHGRVYAIFACAREPCRLSGTDGLVGEISTIFPICGPGVRAIGSAHAVAEAALTARLEGRINQFDATSFLERNVRCPDNVMDPH